MADQPTHAPTARPAPLPTGWTEAHRWPPFTHGRILCKGCGNVVASCQCAQACRTVGTVEWCAHCDPTRAELAQSRAGKISPPTEALIKHEKGRILYAGYRSAAKRLFPGVHHADHSNVQTCETGAFVEVHVWVPKEEAEKEGEHRG